MKKITAAQALALIAGREEIHCLDSNPKIMPGALLSGWNKEYPSAVEAIDTAEELLLLDESETFLDHSLMCVNTKGAYPEHRVFMEVFPSKVPNWDAAQN